MGCILMYVIKIIDHYKPPFCCPLSKRNTHENQCMQTYEVIKALFQCHQYDRTQEQQLSGSDVMKLQF